MPFPEKEKFIEELMQLHEFTIGFKQWEHLPEREIISDIKYEERFVKFFGRIPKAAVIIMNQSIHMANKSIETIF